MESYSAHFSVVVFFILFTQLVNISHNFKYGILSKMILSSFSEWFQKTLWRKRKDHRHPNAAGMHCTFQSCWSPCAYCSIPHHINIIAIRKTARGILISCIVCLSTWPKQGETWLSTRLLARGRRSFGYGSSWWRNYSRTGDTKLLMYEVDKVVKWWRVNMSWVLILSSVLSD